MIAPEDRLLFECCRGEVDPAGAERIAELLAGPLDWDAVLSASIRHGVAPLLRRGLAQGGSIDRVPAHVREALTALHDGSARRNRRLVGSLGEIVAALRAGGVDPVGLKDIQLAAEIYPEPALRPMGDIDLLIRREDWATAASCLTGLGLLPRPGADVPYTRKYAPAQHFRRAADEVWIDLQWNVMELEWDRYGEGRFTYDGLSMWTASTPIALDGYEIRVPVLEDMLFHLCVHLEGHEYSELVLFCDIAELLRARGDEIDWDRFVATARSYRAECSVYYVLALSAALLGATVPDEILHRLKPPYFRSALLGPVFANLTPLHTSLDEIRLAVAPPQPLMDELERVVRRQTARALALDAALDGLATTFLERGGQLLMVNGAPSQRAFPDTSLPAFEPLDVRVCKHDAPLLSELLAAPIRVPIATADPVLSGETPVLSVCSGSGSGKSLPTRGEPDARNAGRAWRSLRNRLRNSADDDREAVARLVIHPVEPEELVVELAAKVGAADHDQLFVATELLDALWRLEGELDWRQIAELAARGGVGAAVSAGLGVAAALGAAVPPGSDAAGASSRVLEWARYGPSSNRRYPWLRRAYYFAFALLATPGLRPKLRYLANSSRSLIPALARELVTGMVRSRRPTTPSTQELAHWVEPRTAAQLERALRSRQSGGHNTAPGSCIHSAPCEDRNQSAKREHGR